MRSDVPTGAAFAHSTEKVPAAYGSTKLASTVAWSPIGDDLDRGATMVAGTAAAAGTIAAGHSHSTEHYREAGAVGYAGQPIGAKNGSITHMAELESPLVGTAQSQRGPAGGAAELEGSSAGWSQYSAEGQSSPRAPLRPATINDGIWELQTDHGRS